MEPARRRRARAPALGRDRAQHRARRPGPPGLRHARDRDPVPGRPAPRGRSRGVWHAGSGAIFRLRSNRLRPRGWTSADAAGLPILPGLARYDEVASGAIHHALRFTVSRTRRAFVFPARHVASPLTDPDLPAMGQRLRLKRSVDISPLPRQARVIATALKRYGMLVADNGSDWFITGAPDRRWDDDALHALGRLHGSDFEVVSEASPGAAAGP